MSDEQPAVPPATPAPVDARQLGVLLACFDTRKAAGQAIRTLQGQLDSHRDTLLENVVVKVNAKHKASGHDPRQVRMGALTAGLTWGIFGLLTGSHGWVSGIVWVVIGAICGGIFSYYSVTHLSKQEWARIGNRLPADSSALAVFIETDDVPRLLTSAASTSPSTASAAAISPDLTTRVFAGPATPADAPVSPAQAGPSAGQPDLSMVVIRYPSQNQARQKARELSATAKHPPPAVAVELIIERAADGHLRVTDPKYGTWAYAKTDTLSWGALGLVFGLLAGLISGGLFGAVSSGIVIGVFCAAFGLGAGALYGLWAGRAISARRLKSVTTLLGPGTSMLLAWSWDGRPRLALELLATGDSKHTILRFQPVDGGVTLETA